MNTVCLLLLIVGQERGAADGRTFDCRSPATGKVVTRSAAATMADAAREYRVAAQIEAGICHINGPTVHDEAQMPFGRVKASGYGRFGGKAGIHEFTDLCWITVQHRPRHYPI